ncbi:MAG: hypothetical protein QM498_11420, partial [Desulfobacterium sp.]
DIRKFLPSYPYFHVGLSFIMHITWICLEIREMRQGMEKGFLVAKDREGILKKNDLITVSFCVFVPEEIALAANATQVGLCSGADFAMEAVDAPFSRPTISVFCTSRRWRTIIKPTE